MEQDLFKFIAANYETPTYVFDKKKLIHQVDLIRNRLPAGTMLCFAMKANPFMAGVLAEMVDRLEVCSPGEYEICIREHIDAEKIVVSGVNKTLESMERILSYSQGAGIYTIESELHYQILKQCAGKIGKRLKVLLRLSSGNQFGMDEAALERVLSMLQDDNVMDVIGIHYYSGTQKKRKKIESELQMLDAYGKKLRERYGIGGLELEYGPGLMVSYFKNAVDDEPASVDSSEQLDMLSCLLSDIGVYIHISIELGRFLTWDCGYYMTRIMDIKHTGKTGFVIVDGGIHQINYYGQMMGMKIPYTAIIRMKNDFQNATGGGEFDKGAYNVSDVEDCIYAKESGMWTICGSLCTVNDVLVRGIELNGFDIGDILVFERCGAYAVTEGMAMFLSRELPQVLLVDENRDIRILREKTEINLLNGIMEEKENGRIN